MEEDGEGREEPGVVAQQERACASVGSLGSVFDTARQANRKLV